MIQKRQPETEWILRPFPKDISREQIEKTAETAGIPEQIVRFLAARGYVRESDIKEYLSPSLGKLPRPHHMKGMTAAVKLFLDGLASSRPITVYGDFDADGVTATAVLFQFFSELAVPLQYYIPDRLLEGYGLNAAAVRNICQSNVSQYNDPGILITADCGISDDAAVETAKKLGFTVIITDHHKPPEKLPPADAIINPLQPGCDFPFKNLAGVGVAFFFILGLRSELISNKHWPANNIPNLKSYMDLVAIGTVADQVPITGCNRIIVKAGLEILSRGNRLGLKKLLENANTSGTEVNSEDIAFRIAPRINAIGRLDSARKAVDLLCTNEQETAARLAADLEMANNSRKKIEAEIFIEATDMVSSLTGVKNSLLLYKNDWHQGVLGIVASRLADTYGRPTILLTEYTANDFSDGESLVKGSGRSIEGLDIHAAVFSCRELLVRFGGHEGAVGVTLPRESIVSFRKRFDLAVGEQLQENVPNASLVIDAESTIDVLQDKKFLAAYNLLAPFGNGNPEPIFCMNGQNMINLRHIRSNHLRFTIRDNGRLIDGIGFGFAGFIPEAERSLMDIAFNLRFNSYMGQNKWEMFTVALRPSHP